MPKKRSSKDFSVPLWLALFALLIVSLLYSPATALRRIVVLGAEKPYEAYITNSLKKLKGKPALQVSPLLVESQMMLTSAVKSAKFSRNAFGRGKLSIVYRVAVARFESNGELYLDEDGTIFRSLRKQPHVAAIDLYEGGLRPTLTQTGIWPSRRIAMLAKMSKKYDFGDNTVIEVQEVGAVSLITDSGVTIRLGSSYDFEKKLALLDQLIREHSDLFKKARSINLVSPDRPLWTPRG